MPGFWDLDERYERLSAVGDPLEKLNAIIPWLVFEKPLAKALKRSDGSEGGRPPFPAVLMLKILMLQALYDLSDDQAARHRNSDVRLKEPRGHRSSPRLFIRGWTVTSTSAHDGAQLRNVVTTDNTESTVWADSAYCSKTNEEWLERNGLTSDIHQRKPKRKPMPKAMSRANGRRSKVRSAIEHVFARQKDKMRLFIRAKVKIGMADIAYNMLRYFWHQGRTASV